MFAILALVSFLVALVLHLAHDSKFVEDFVILGLALVAAHLAWGVGWPWPRARP